MPFPKKWIKEGAACIFCEKTVSISGKQMNVMKWYITFIFLLMIILAFNTYFAFGAAVAFP